MPVNILGHAIDIALAIFIIGIAVIAIKDRG